MDVRRNETVSVGTDHALRAALSRLLNDTEEIKTRLRGLEKSIEEMKKYAETIHG